MTDLEFQDRAEALLRSIETSCDRLNEALDVDLDSQRVGGMITITFEDRSQIVINLQKPLHEVWLASREGGHHYRWSEGQWSDTRTGQAFLDDLSYAATLQAGRPLNFQPDT